MIPEEGLRAEQDGVSATDDRRPPRRVRRTARAVGPRPPVPGEKRIPGRVRLLHAHSGAESGEPHRRVDEAVAWRAAREGTGIGHPYDAVGLLGAPDGCRRQQPGRRGEGGAGDAPADESVPGREEGAEGGAGGRGQVVVRQLRGDEQDIGPRPVEPGVQDARRHRRDVESHLPQREQLARGDGGGDAGGAEGSGAGEVGGLERHVVGLGGLGHLRPGRLRLRARPRLRHDRAAVRRPAYRNPLSQKGVEGRELRRVGER